MRCKHVQRETDTSAKGSNVDLLGDAQGILKFDTQVSDSAVGLCVAEQKLYGTEVASLAVNFRCFCPTQRMSAVSAGFQSNRCHLIADKSAILTRRIMRPVVNTARKHETATNHLRRFDPRENRMSGVLRQLELNWLP